MTEWPCCISAVAGGYVASESKCGLRNPVSAARTGAVSKHRHRVYNPIKAICFV